MRLADTLVLMTEQSAGEANEANTANTATGRGEQDEFRYLASDAARVGRQAPLPQVRRVEVPVGDGRTISALSYGSSSPAGDARFAPQYVFLHGMGLNAHGFDPVALALDAPALAFDLPGHGRSAWREDANYRPDLLAADVLVAIDHLAPEPFVLVGHSLGGLVAAIAAPMLGARLRGLVIVDITPGVSPQGDAGSIGDFISGQRDFATQEEMVDRAVAYGIGEDRAALARGVAFNARQRSDGRWEWAHHFAHMEAAPMDGMGEGTPFAPIWAPLESVQQGGTRVSLVRGSDGLIGPELVAEWRTRLPRSEVVTVAGPHNVHEASPTELAAAILALSQ